jgi:hypothetical protein
MESLLCKNLKFKCRVLTEEKFNEVGAMLENFSGITQMPYTSDVQNDQHQSAVNS